MLAARAARAAAAIAVTVMAALAVLAPAASAAPVGAARPGAPPPGAWDQVQSDMDNASALVSGRGVTIALLSTGVDIGVGDLAGKVIDGPDFIFKPQGPLTHAYGTLAAEFILGVPGVDAGLAPGARILALRTDPDSSEPASQSFFNTPGTDPELPEARAIRYAVSHGAAVIDIDAAYGTPDPQLVSAVDYALARNVVVVAPEYSLSSNPGWTYVYPAGLPGVIGVSAVVLPGGPAPYSPPIPMETNNSVLISGPANSVTMSSDGWGDEGSGVAVPLVAATAALIKEDWPRMPPALVARALAMSARYHPAGGYSQSEGFGVLDAYDALLDADKLAHLTATAPAGVPGTVAAGAHFGGGPPPGVISALPPAWPSYVLYGALVAVGAAALACAALLAARRRPRRATALQQLAQPEQVLHARVDLHPARHPGAGDVHRRLGERHHLVAVRGQPDVGGRLARPDLPHLFVP